jgi:hypothetical protein
MVESRWNRMRSPSPGLIQQLSVVVVTSALLARWRICDWEGITRYSEVVPVLCPSMDVRWG